MKSTKSIKRMNERSLTFMTVCLMIFMIFQGKMNAQMKADDILGRYVVPSKDGAIEIYKNGNKYNGKIILNKDPNKLDVNNPDKDKRTRKTLGMTILNDFEFNGDDVWHNGTIYDPKNGKTYSCKITRMENGDLNIRGFIGVSLLGRTETFARIKD